MSADLKRVLAELERKNAASEPTQPEAVTSPPNQTETQIDAPVLKAATMETAVDQVASYAATGEPQKVEDSAKKDNSDASGKAMDASLPVQPVQIPAQHSVPPRTHAQPASKNFRPLLLLGGGAAGLVLLVLIAIFILGNLLKPEAAAPVANTPEEAAQAAANTVPLVIATDTEAPTQTLAPTATSMPTETPIPTNTLPPLYVRINNISVNASYQYVVEYETFGYAETLPGMHVHFFFDTVPPAQAGVPGSGPWILYGGPRPFTEYKVSDRPGSATQMCALVANANHSIIPESGNCYALP
jgi:hypothetical protein